MHLVRQAILRERGHEKAHAGSHGRATLPLPPVPETAVQQIRPENPPEAAHQREAFCVRVLRDGVCTTGLVEDAHRLEAPYVQW